MEQWIFSLSSGLGVTILTFMGWVAITLVRNTTAVSHLTERLARIEHLLDRVDSRFDHFLVLKSHKEDSTH